MNNKKIFSIPPRERGIEKKRLHIKSYFFHFIIILRMSYNQLSRKQFRPVFIREKDQLFELENAHIEMFFYCQILQKMAEI